MTSLDNLVKEVKALKKENSIIKKRLSALESGKSQEPTTFESQSYDSESSSESTSALSTVLIVIGILLTLTVIGIVIGLPLMIWGFNLKSKESKKAETKPVQEIKTIKEKTSKPIKKKEDSTSFEENVGLKWFSRIGILALVIGVGFFIKYAIDNNWVNHLTRIVMGVALGIGLVVFGEILSKKEKYTVWAKSLVGGGFAMTYFVVYASYHFQEYQTAIGIGQGLNIFLLSLVVLFAIYFSVKDDSQIIAAESFFLGYITSLLSNSFGLMTIIYTLLLTIGLVFVVSYKKWSVIGICGIIASYILYLFWNFDNPNKFLLGSVFLISYFIAFGFQSLFLSTKKELMGQTIAATLINSFLFFILYFFKIDNHYPDYTGLFTLLLCIFYFFAYLFYDRVSSKELSTTNLYLGILYLTLTIPIQLNNVWVTLIWAIETLILTLLSIKLNNKTLRICSYVVGAFTFIKTLFIDSFRLGDFVLHDLLKSTRFFSYLATIICFYAIYLALRNLDKDKVAKVFSVIYSWAALFLLIVISFIELDTNLVWITIFMSILFSVYIRLSNTKFNEMFYQSLLLFGVLLLKVVFVDSAQLNKFDSTNFFSSTLVFAYFVTCLSFYLNSKYIENNKDKFPDSAGTFSIVLSYAATALAFLWIIIEFKEFWISVGWSILALIVMMFGFVNQRKHLRLQGIILFGITILKVFMYDTRELDTLFRTLSYIGLGVLLLLVSFVYAKFKDKLKQIL